MTMLADLPGDLLALALRFADHRELLQLEQVNARVKAVVTQFRLWQALASSLLLVDAERQAQRSERDWKRLVQLSVTPPVDRERSQLVQVRDCSSVDHENESAENTLRRSQCGVEIGFLSDTLSGGHPLAFLQLAARIQVACGCARGRPCYWSTASTWSHKTVDFIEYNVRSDCLLDSVQVVPYRVFWYPGSPTYSPKQVSFALYETNQDGSRCERPLYESEELPVVRDMKSQKFQLPKRVFLSRGVLRVNLIGRQEDVGADVLQWMEENDLPPYYICLSYVGASGQPELVDA